MPQDIKEKIKLLYRIKDENARNLAIFEFLQNLEKMVNSLLQEARTEIESIKEATKLATTEVLERVKGEVSSLVEKAIKEQVFNRISQIKGDTGEPGYMPQKKVDYWTDEEINQITSEIQSKIRIPKDGKDGQTIVGPSGKSIKGEKGNDGLPGKIPEKGIDYFTEKEIKGFISKVKDELNMEKILNEIKSLKEILEGMKKQSQFGGQRILHRGGATLEWEAPSGTCNGINTTFTLSNTPYDSNMVLFFINGQLMKKDDDYTISGKTITATIAPPTGSVVYAHYRKS